MGSLSIVETLCRLTPSRCRALALLALLGLGAAHVGMAAGHTRRPRPVVAVAEFQNATPWETAGRACTYALRTVLAECGRFELAPMRSRAGTRSSSVAPFMVKVPVPNTGPTTAGAEAYVAVGQLDGQHEELPPVRADYRITGAVTLLGDRVQLNAIVHRARLPGRGTGFEVLGSVTADGKGTASIPQVASDIAKQVRCLLARQVKPKEVDARGLALLREYRAGRMSYDKAAQELRALTEEYGGSFVSEAYLLAHLASDNRRDETVLAQAKVVTDLYDRAEPSRDRLLGKLGLRPFVVLAECAERAGKWEEAARAYSAAVEAGRPLTLDARKKRVWAYLEAGDAENAEAAVQMLGRRVPGDGEVAYLQGRLAEMKGDTRTAIEKYTACKCSAPSSKWRPDCERRLSELLRRHGTEGARPDEADTPDAANADTPDATRQEGSPKVVPPPAQKRPARRAMDGITLQKERIELYLDTGRTDAAGVAVGALAKRAPTDPDLVYYRARVAEAQGNLRTAIEQYATYKALSPSGKWLQECDQRLTKLLRPTVGKTPDPVDKPDTPPPPDTDRPATANEGSPPTPVRRDEMTQENVLAYLDAGDLKKAAAAIEALGKVKGSNPNLVYFRGRLAEAQGMLDMANVMYSTYLSRAGGSGQWTSDSKKRLRALIRRR